MCTEMAERVRANINEARLARWSRWVAKRFRNMEVYGLLNELHKLAVAEGEAHSEVDAYYAPSECHGDVSRAFDEARAKLFEPFGMDVESGSKWVYSIVSGLTSEKFAFFGFAGRR